MTKKKVTLKELADLVDGDLVGDPNIVIDYLAPVEVADAGDITFLVKAGKPEDLREIKASAVIVPMALEDAGIAIIRVRDPYLASAIIQNFLLKEEFQAKGIHEHAHIGKDCLLSEELSIGPMVVIGDRVKIGRQVVIQPGVVIEDDVEIGDGTTVQANATIGARCKVGDRVLIHPGVVIGSDGYGFATDPNGCHVKRPQLGRVIIGDDVEIGANSCIDRATFGETRIHSGVKIDNLVHVAHNVEVGENSLLVAQCGIAGSTTLGRNVVVGGAVAIKDHLRIEDGVMIAPKSGVHNNQPKGVVLSGIPAIPIQRWIKAATVFGKLPDMHKEIRKLKKQLAELKKDSE